MFCKLSRTLPTDLFVLIFWAVIPAIGADSLQYYKNYFVTGDYAVAGVGLHGTGVNGWATGTITMSGVPCTKGIGATGCSTPGAIPADVVAAYLYWETDELTATPSSRTGYFDGHQILGTPLGNTNNPSCYSSGGTNGTGAPTSAGRVYRADVMPLLPVDSVHSVRLVNGPHTVKLPDSGGSGNGNLPFTNGATLVVVYKVVVAGAPGFAPLKSVVVYDGAYTMVKQSAGFSQNVGGFYQATGGTKSVNMTPIAAGGIKGNSSTIFVNGASISTNSLQGSAGARWDDPVLPITLGAGAASYSAQITPTTNQTCLTFAALVTSTPVVDSDLDGLVDIWETNGIHLNPGTSTTPATFGGCSDYSSEPCVDLPAMGAVVGTKDIFLQLDYMTGSVPGRAEDAGPHTHMPTLAALEMVCTAFANHKVALHFDVGNNYQPAAPGGAPNPCIIPYQTDTYGNQLAQGGNSIPEGTYVCNAAATTCTYTEGYPVVSFKRGFLNVRDGNPAIPPSKKFPGGIPARPGFFAHNRKDSFHYVLFAHALSGPFNSSGQPTDLKGNPSSNPNSISGIADRPGGDVMISLGLWNTQKKTTDMVGTDLIQAGTLMHELGHNLNLSHDGLQRSPNCVPPYQSVMNYLYQTRGLTDAAGNEHIDYSNNSASALSEASPGTIIGLNYQLRFFAPYNSNQVGTSPATSLCGGATVPANEQGIITLTESPGKIQVDGSLQFDWKNGVSTYSGPVDLNFDGVLNQNLTDQPDWASLDLQQVGGRPNANGYSSDVGFADEGFADEGFADEGFADEGFADEGFADEGSADGDVDLNTTLATGPSAPTNLTSLNTINSIVLNWVPPTIGLVDHYIVYRCAVISPATTCIPAAPAYNNNVPGNTSTPSFTDTVTDNTDAGEGGSAACAGNVFPNMCNNTTYIYQVTAAIKVTVNGSNTTTETLPTLAVSNKVAHLFVVATSQSVVYGNPIPPPTIQGDIPGGLDPTLVSCAYTSLKTNTVVSPRNVDQYAIKCIGPATTPTSTTDGVTYNQQYLTYVPGTLTITQRPITIAAQPYTKTYDATVSTGLVVPVVTPGLVSGDSAVLSEAFVSKIAANPAAITVTSVVITDGNGGNNYAVTLAGAQGTINQRPLTVTATGVDKQYDGTTAATVTLADNHIAGDLVSDSYTSAAFAAPDVGYGVTVNATGITISGGDAGNYFQNTTSTTIANIYGFGSPYVLQNWTAAGAASNPPGATTSIAPTDPAGNLLATPLTMESAGAAFSYNLNLGNPGGGVPSSRWTFQTTAAPTGNGTVSFHWHYTGFHAFFEVTALLQVFSGANVTTLYSAGPIDCCTSPSSGFDVSGDATIAVTPGQPFGFVVGGSNGDSNSQLTGTLTITNFKAPF